MIDRTRTIFMALTYSKKGVCVNTPNGEFLTDIRTIEQLLSGEINSITLNYLDRSK